MRVENNLPVHNVIDKPTGLNSKNSTNDTGVKNSSIEHIKLDNSDNFVKSDIPSSNIYNRFKKTSTDNKKLEFVNSTILRPGSNKAINLHINYDGIAKSDFRNVEVWKNTIGKTVYAINKTLEYVNDNSQVSFPSKIEYEETYTKDGVANKEAFYENLANLANKLTDNKTDINDMYENISPSLENYI